MEALEKLYWQLLDAWNRNHAGDFAALFASDGSVVGFDGSQMEGPSAIQRSLEGIFSDHDPARYVERSGRYVNYRPKRACSEPSRA